MDWSHILTMIGWGCATMVLTMSLFWAIAQRSGNAGIVDVVWGFAFAPLAVLYAYLSTSNHWGFGLRTGIILFMVVIWSVRLGCFLLSRFRRLWPEEDGRYTQYKKEWGKNAALGLFLAYQLQALLLASLTLPYAVVMANDSRVLGVYEVLGALIWLVAVVGEALADSQLENFKKDPANKGKVCQIGLWNYSRHPNYFFEWLIWISFFVFSLGSGGGIFTVYCPVVMYVFLTRVTGIKATEEQSLRTRGDAYRVYQKTTSAFVPWFKGRAN